jgi:hypothetical protein
MAFVAPNDLLRVYLQFKMLDGMDHGEIIAQRIPGYSHPAKR